jgi:hypothetical protein
MRSSDTDIDGPWTDSRGTVAGPVCVRSTDRQRSRIRRRGAVATLIGLAAACSWSLAAQAATIRVTTATDDVIPNDGGVSLREAITAINAGNNLGDPDIISQIPGIFGTNDTINFTIPGSPIVIKVGSDASALNIPLPSLTKPVLINTASPQQVYLDGTQAGANTNGLTLTSGGSTINGLSFGHWSGAGIYVGSANNLVTGNFIGTYFGGTTPTANANGIVVAAGSSNTIGGTTAAARNVISGNTINGIVINGGSGTAVTGNFIGTTLAGTGSLSNGGDGILIGGGSASNYVGGFSAGTGNVISGNTAAGVLITDPGTTGNLVAGNFIGTDISGATPLFNGGSGVDLTMGAAGNTLLSNTIGSGTFPINMNGLANHDADNSFLMPSGVSNFVIGATNPATVTLGSPATNGANVNVPYTVANGIAGDSLFTTLYRAQCGTMASANPVWDDSLMLGGSGGGSGTYTFPAPLPGGTLFGGGDGDTSATNLLNACLVPPVTGGGATPGGGTTPTGNPEVFFDPTTNTFLFGVGLSPDSMSFTQGNPNSFQTDFVITPAIIGVEGARGSSTSAGLAKKHKSKHKGKKKAKSFPLKSVSITLASGKRQLVKVPLTAKAKAYLKHEVGKSVVVKLITQESDGTGHSKTFQRTLNVKVLKQKTKKKKH